MHLRYQLSSLLLLLAPFAVLLVLAQCSFPTSKSIRAFFLSSAPSLKPSIEAGPDGTLAAHVAASLTRVMLGTTHWRCSLPFRSACASASVGAKASGDHLACPHSGCRAEHSNAGERQRDLLALTWLVDRADAVIENT